MLDNPNPVIYNVGHFADSVSDAGTDPYFCGLRQFSFTRSDTGGDASDLVTIRNGNWDLQASSSSYNIGIITIDV